MTPVLTPGSLPALWQAMEAHPEAVVYAGGTDILVWRRAGRIDPPALIHLGGLAELCSITQDGPWLRLGAGCTHRALLNDDRVRGDLPVLAQALAVLGSPPIRAMGTLGGNLCTASPAGDTLPPLVALDAEVELLGRDGSRRMPVREFITGPGRTKLAAGEIVAAVRVRRDGAWTVQHFEKVGLRAALACSLVSLAALLRLDGDGRVEQAALAWGSVGPVVMRCPKAEALLTGRPLSAQTLREAAAAVRAEVNPISDVRANADYRRRVAGNLLLRLTPDPPAEVRS
jgi:CO/xanthine dehydrogenase FAD-binding subunit